MTGRDLAMGYESNESITCPQCGSLNVVPIVYGSPTAIAQTEWENGVIHIGGSPSLVLQKQGNREFLANCYCKGCSHKWDEKPWPWLGGTSTYADDDCKYIHVTDLR